MEFEVGDKVRVWDFNRGFEGLQGTVKDFNPEGNFVGVIFDGKEITKTFFPAQCRLLERPKKKVKLYQIAWYSEEMKIWNKTQQYFRSTKEFSEYHSTKTFTNYFIVENSMIEVDEGE
jgi:hypothetical protein